jgi:hypothetical protein
MEMNQASGVIRFQPASTPREDSVAAERASETQVGAAPQSDRRAPGDEIAAGVYPGPLNVRPVRLLDLPQIRQTAVVARLNQPEMQLASYSAMKSAVLALAPRGRIKPRFYVASSSDGMLGFAQFQPILPDQRWHLIALGASTGVYDPIPIWEALVEHGTISAGLRGVKRLYAKVPVDWPASEALRAVGFAPYATETIYLARQPAVDATTRPRRQEQTDTWAIHQLYNALVPRQVQYAEAFTSHRWDVRTRFDGQHGQEARGWIVEDGHHVIGYVRILSRGRTHVMEVLNHPERPEIVGPLIGGALADLSSTHRLDLVYCAVRGYQEETGTLLQRCGFRPIVEQELHLKYTTAHVRVTAPEAVVFHTEVIEKLPKRVPSYLHGSPSDESAI